MAKVSELQGALILCKAAGSTPFIWGKHGLGKSSLVKQLAEEMNWGFIDVRCSQMEASDIRGLPARGDDGRTHFYPPAEMPVGDMTNAKVELEILRQCDFIEDMLPNYSDLIAERDVKKPGKLTPINWAEIRTKVDEVQSGHLKKVMTELQPRFVRGILFLDELNRATDDVLQAIFQLVLDARVGQYSLPPGWCVVAAGNFNEGYITNGFTDAALMDRFCHLTISDGQSTLDEWSQYMGGAHGLAASPVIEFVSSNLELLDGRETKAKMDVTVTPSRRSWDTVTRVLTALPSVSADIQKFTDVENARQLVLAGLVGQECAIAFQRYDCPVKVNDVVKHGVEKYKAKLNSLNRNQLAGLMWGLSSYVTERIEEKPIGMMALDFAEVLVSVKSHGRDNDLCVAFLKNITRGLKTNNSSDVQRMAMLVNPVLASKVVEFRKKHGGNTESFVEWANQRPALQKILHESVWDSSMENSKK